LNAVAVLFTAGNCQAVGWVGS